MEPTFTVPAFNMRALPYDMAQVVFGAAQKQRVGAFVLALARFEMTYTCQEPAEHVACISPARSRLVIAARCSSRGITSRLLPDAYHHDRIPT